jgi:hypothetical protein
VCVTAIVDGRVRSTAGRCSAATEDVIGASLLSSRSIHLLLLAALTLSTSAAVGVARAASTATTAPAAATAPATSQPVRAVSVDGTLVQPMSRCTWGDLLHVAVRGGKLEVESHPPDAIAGYLRNRKQIDVEITDAADRYWRLQGVAPQQPIGPVGGGAAVILPGGARIRIGGAQARPPAPAPALPAAAPPGAQADDVDFTANVLGRGRTTDTPQVARLMLMHGTFQLRGRWMRDGKIYQIDFRSYADRTNVTLQVRELLRGRRAVVLSMEAGDLQQLRRDRHEEVRKYLEPMLIEICGGGARNPLRPQAGDVYRVFESIPADSAALERVKRIVDSFDALEPVAREAASRQLNQLGRAEVLAAARLDRTELSAEQSLRLDAFVARHSAVTDIAAARRDALFLIDCLEDDDRAVRAAALLQLRQTTGQPIEFDLDAPADQRAGAAAALVTPFLPARAAQPSSDSPK